jgi:hypothetical protein
MNLTNCVFLAQSIGNGGTLGPAGGRYNYVVKHCTFTQDPASAVTTGLYWFSAYSDQVGTPAHAAFQNCIFNTPGRQTQIFSDQSSSGPPPVVTAGKNLFNIAGHGGVGTDLIEGVGIEVAGNPMMAADNYHLTAASTLAIDAGGSVGVTVDVDGDSRPNGAGFDLGADEFYGAPAVNAARQWTLY